MTDWRDEQYHAGRPVCGAIAFVALIVFIAALIFLASWGADKAFGSIRPAMPADPGCTWVQVPVASVVPSNNPALIWVCI